MTCTPGFDQIIPVLDALGISLAHRERQSSTCTAHCCPEARAPSRSRIEPGFRDGLDVIRQRERHHVGFEAVDDRARLAPGAAMRLSERRPSGRRAFAAQCCANASLNSRYSSRVGSYETLSSETSVAAAGARDPSAAVSGFDPPHAGAMAADASNNASVKRYVDGVIRTAPFFSVEGEGCR